jgi:nucleoside 2-deoxyribosyltransferase
MKKVYIAHAMTNRDSVVPMDALVIWLKQHKCRVTHPKYALFREELALATLDAIRASDVLVADVSTYSHGVGFELGYAYALGKNTIVVAHASAGSPVSEFIKGLYPDLVYYEHATDLIARVGERLGIATEEPRRIHDRVSVFAGAAISYSSSR